MSEAEGDAGSATLGPLGKLAELETVWVALAALAVAHVVVPFSGSGDSGQIDDINAYLTSPVENRTNAGVDVLLPDVLSKQIEEITDRIMDSQDLPDWYNNDGGNGDVTWYVSERSIVTTVNQARTEYDTTTHVYCGSDPNDPTDATE
jgi:hypothetical protein